MHIERRSSSAETWRKRTDWQASCWNGIRTMLRHSTYAPRFLGTWGVLKQHSLAWRHYVDWILICLPSGLLLVHRCDQRIRVSTWKVCSLPDCGNFIAD